MKQCDEIMHRVDSHNLGSVGDHPLGAVTPAGEHHRETGALRGFEIDQGIPAIERAFCRTVQRRKRHPGGVGSGFSRAIRRAADDRVKVAGKAKVCEDFLAQDLWFVRADGAANAALCQGVERFGNAGKGQISGRRGDAVPGAERLKVSSGINRMRAHDSRNHLFAADCVHHPDHVAIGRFLNAAIDKHGIDDLSGQPGAVDQGAIKIEDNMLYCHQAGFLGGHVPSVDALAMAS